MVVAWHRAHKSPQHNDARLGASKMAEPTVKWLRSFAAARGRPFSAEEAREAFNKEHGTEHRRFAFSRLLFNAQCFKPCILDPRQPPKFWPRAPPENPAPRPSVVIVIAGEEEVAGCGALAHSLGSMFKSYQVFPRWFRRQDKENIQLRPKEGNVAIWVVDPPAHPWPVNDADRPDLEARVRVTRHGHPVDIVVFQWGEVDTSLPSKLKEEAAASYATGEDEGHAYMTDPTTNVDWVVAKEEHNSSCRVCNP